MHAMASKAGTAARIALPVPVKAVVIDMDGTLLDTIGDLAGAANAMRSELGHAPLDPELLRTFVRKGIVSLVSRPYRGAGKGLRALRAKGLRLGCDTNKSARFTQPLLECSGLAGYFEIVLSGASLPRKNPIRCRCCMRRDFSMPSLGSCCSLGTR
jgi:phosphoglycolate phosphatase